MGRSSWMRLAVHAKPVQGVEEEEEKGGKEEEDGEEEKETKRQLLFFLNISILSYNNC